LGSKRDEKSLGSKPSKFGLRFQPIEPIGLRERCLPDERVPNTKTGIGNGIVEIQLRGGFLKFWGRSPAREGLPGKPPDV